MISNGETGQALPSPVPAGPDTRQDPAMKALFRMSRTAGVGLQDYAEVNVLAVVGLILGLASFIAHAANDSLAVLIIPAVAVIVCLFAAVQVLRSNGTQTGLPLAILGLLLALGFAGSNVAAHVQTNTRENQYHAELNTLVGKLRTEATTQSLQSAYDLFDARFRETVQPATFGRVLQQRMNFTFPGKPVTSVTLGDLVVYETDDSGTITATTLLILHADGTFPDGSPIQASDTIDFKRTDVGGWRIHSIPSWFGEAKKPGVAAQ